jgi:maleate isomerase
MRFAGTVLYVDDVLDSAGFYRRVFGLEMRFFDGSVGFGELETGGSILALASYSVGEMLMPGQHAAVEIGFFTSDVPSLFAKAIDAGAVAVAPPKRMPWGLEVAYLRSPDGTIIGLSEPPKSAGLRIGVGLIVPSSNTVMEPDFHRHLTNTAVVSTTRIFLEQITREAELRMLEEDLSRAAQLIRTTAPDIVVFGCTSAGSLDGLDHDLRVGQTIEQITGVKTVTVLQAVLAQLGKLGAERVAVFTPYEEELTNSVAQCVGEGGYKVVLCEGMGIRQNLDIGKVAPDEIVSFVKSHMTGVAADCLFLSCTNWRAMEAIESLRNELGLPVVSSNQAAIELVTRSAPKES